jgi:putative nucleotidyltransferase with HDIG domain
MNQSKTRILFVDDEPIILELLRLSVSSMKGEWETAFAKSAEEALGLMENGRPSQSDAASVQALTPADQPRAGAAETDPFDIVVTDMQLPGISGAQLLNEVMRRFPATIRIILSGYGDQELVMKCVGSAHQFLLKPFKLADLKSALKRINGLKERLHSAEIQRLVGRKEFLPSVPDVYFKVLDALQNPDCPVERIGKIVDTDPAVTIKLLQLVNSAFLGFAREVSSADEAVMILGTGTIRSLVLSLHLFSVYSASKPESGSLEKVWSHSVRVGRLAQRIARLEGADEKVVEESFTAGLLHDVGKLILSENPSVNYLQVVARAREGKLRLVDAERAAFEATHAEVGAYLLDLWGLPLPLVEAVAWHHEPARVSEPVFGPLTAVHVANVLDQKTTCPEGVADELDGDYLEQLKLGGRIEAWLKEANTI